MVYRIYVAKKREFANKTLHFRVFILQEKYTVKEEKWISKEKLLKMSDKENIDHLIKTLKIKPISLMVWPDYIFTIKL